MDCLFIEFYAVFAELRGASICIHGWMVCGYLQFLVDMDRIRIPVFKNPADMGRIGIFIG